VTLRDIDAAKVAALNDGQVPIYEPGLTEVMVEHADRLTYTRYAQGQRHKGFQSVVVEFDDKQTGAKDDQDTTA